MRPPPVVKLYRNPWRHTLSNKDILLIMRAAAVKADGRLQGMIVAGEVEDGRDSFGAVFFDPTRPRHVTCLADRILATIELGPNGAKFLPNGLAKADAHDRHGLPNGELVKEASHCLGNNDFAWGNSAEYRRAIGGGSGLSAKQDRDMVYGMLKDFYDPIRHRRDDWLADQRTKASHGWYNPSNAPGQEYQDALAAVAALTMTPASNWP